MKKAYVVLAILGLIMSASVAWGQTIAGWDFTGVGSVSLPTYGATTFNANLVSASGANNITRGATAAWSTGTNSFRTTGFQNNGIATSNTDYFQITLEAAAGHKVSLSTIDARFAGTATFYASPGVTSQFAYSLDGTTFTLIGSPVTSTSLTMTQIDLTGVGALQNVASGTTITLRYYASGQTTTGGWGFNSPAAGQNGLAIGGTVQAFAPTTQASSITFPGSTPSSLSISWTYGSGTRRAVFMKEGAGSITNPTNGTTYTASTNWSSKGTQLGTSGYYCIYDGTGTSVAITNLSPATTYYVQVFEYNGGAGSETYNTNTAGGNPNSQATAAGISNPSSFSTTHTTDNRIRLTWTAPSGTYDKVLMFGRATGDITHSPSGAGSSYSDANSAWGSAGVYSTDNKLLYAGTGTDVEITGLTEGTTYYFKAYAYSGSDWSSGTSSVSKKAEVQGVSSLVATPGNTQISLSWTNPSFYTTQSNWWDEVLMLAKSGSAVDAAPTGDGSAYTANAALTSGTEVGTGNFVVYKGTGTSQIVTGLTNGTTYHFRVFVRHGSVWTGVGQYQSTSSPSGVSSSATDYFRSKASGTWGATSTWESSPNNSDWYDATLVPISSAATITIRNGHTVTMESSRSVDELTINAGGQITISSGITLTVADGTGTDLVVNGTMLNSGTLTISSGATWSINSGATYVHNTTTSSSTLLGTNPTISAASTWIYRGSSSLSASISISGRTFGNLTLESSSGAWSPSSTSGTNPLTINGNLSIGGSGAGTVAYSTSGFTAAIPVAGNVTIGTGSSLTLGSSALSVAGNWSNSGTFNPGTSTVTFNGTSTQTFTRTGTGSFNNLTLNNSNGLTLNNDATVNGTLTLTNGALTIGANTLVLNGAVSTTSGSITGGSNSNLTIGGSGASTTLPSITSGLNNLTVNRSNGFSLGADLTVNGVLAFTSGKLSTGASKVVLGSSGSISGEGVGKYVVGTLEVTRTVGTGAETFSGIGISFAAGSGSPGSVTIVRTSGPAGVVNTGTREGIARKWSMTSATSVVRDISFTWVSDDDNGKDVSSVQVWNRVVGGAWQFTGTSQSGSSYVVGSPVFSFVGGTSYEFTILEGIVIGASTTALEEFRTVGLYSVSIEQSYTVYGSNLSGDVVISAPSGFQISTTSGSGFRVAITLVPAGGTLPSTTIYVRFSPTSNRYHNANITHVSTGAAVKNVQVLGFVQQPQITVEAPSILDFGKVAVNSSSASKSYRVKGIDLAGSLLVNAPQGFQISTSSTSDFAPSLAFGGDNVDQMIYVRFFPTKSGPNSGTVTNSSDGASTVSVAVTGTGAEVVLAEPTVQASAVVFSEVTFVSMKVGWTNGNGSARIVLARAETTVDANPNDLNSYGAQSVFGKGNEIGSGNFVVFTGSDNSVTVTGLKQGTTYHFAVFEYNGSGEDINYLITNPARGSAQTMGILLSESFDYPIGTLLSSAGWGAHSGAGTNSITVTSSPLIYQGWPLSGLGNGVSMTTTGEDVNKSFKPQSSGSVFVGFLVNILTAQTGDYFFHLGPDPIGTTYRGRVFVKDDGAGRFQFGLVKGASTNVNYTVTKFSYNTTYLLILEYQIIVGSINDIISLYINPVVGGSPSTTSDAFQSPLAAEKPAAPDLTNLDTDTDITPGTIALRQGTTTSAATLVLSGVRVAPSWDELLVQSSTPIVAKVTATLTTLNFGDVKVGSPSGVMSYSISGSNLNGALNISSPGQFEIGTSASGPFGSTLSLTPTAGAVSQTTVYVRFTPSLLGARSGNILHTSDGADTVRVAVSGVGVEEAAAGQSIQITSFGTPLTETFDGMGSAGTTYPAGWTAIRFGGTGTVGAMLTLGVTEGSAITGNVYNAGTTGANDRALGTLASGTTVPAFGASFTNKTGGVIGKVDVAGIMEQWRSGSSNTVNEVVRFEYSLNATALNNGSWTALTDMDLLEKLTTTTVAAAVNGNDPANQTAISGSVAGITWKPDSILWIRWVDTDDSGSDGLYAIDNFSITVYRPSGLADGDGTAIVRNPNLNNSDVFKRNVSSQIAEIVVTGTTTGTVTSVSIDVPTGWTGLSSANVSLSGAGFSGAIVAVSGSKITLSNASISDANTGTVRIAGLTTPNPVAITDNGNYTFVVQTAKSGGTLSSIKSSPKAYVVIPTASLRDNDPNGVTLDLGAIVATQGVNLNQTSFDVAASEHYLQDGTVGIRVFRSSPGLNLTRGTRYIAKGEVTNSNGRTTIVSTFVYDDGSSALPQPATKTIKEILANPEAFEGTLVKIPTVSKKSGTWPTSNTFSNLIITESPGTDSLALRLNVSTGGSKEPAYPVSITGILSQFDATSPFTEGYQILPRDSADIVVSIPTSASLIPESLPADFALLQNYPNPFNPATVIRFDLPTASNVTLSLFDMLGREVARLVEGNRLAGRYQVTWNAGNHPSGIYLYQLRAESYVSTRKMILMK